MDDFREKHERVTFVLGIIVAAIIGFSLNIYANIYYEVLMLREKSMSNYNQLATVLPAFVLIYSFGFLLFLVYDYKNKIDMSRPFLQRLFEYYETVFWPSRFARSVYRFFIFVFMWVFASIVGLTLFQTLGIYALLVWIVMIVLWQIGKYFYRHKKKITN